MTIEIAADNEPPFENIVLKVAGTPFRCACGANVFHHPKGMPEIFECNACETLYEGDEL
jgi:hypothetical protein